MGLIEVNIQISQYVVLSNQHLTTNSQWKQLSQVNNSSSSMIPSTCAQTSWNICFNAMSLASSNRRCLNSILVIPNNLLLISKIYCSSWFSKLRPNVGSKRPKCFLASFAILFSLSYLTANRMHKETFFCF